MKHCLKKIFALSSERLFVQSFLLISLKFLGTKKSRKSFAGLFLKREKLQTLQAHAEMPRDYNCPNATCSFVWLYRKMSRPFKR